MRLFFFSAALFLFCLSSFAQDSLAHTQTDTTLRIINLNPFFTLQVDSTLSYQLQINKNPQHYFWFLRNAPVGLKIGKDDGLISFKASKAFFLSGRLKYDQPYKVSAGVQNLYDPTDKVDTSFAITFFNTEVTLPKIKPTVFSTIWVNEGEAVSFKVLCEPGNFPIETIIMNASVPLKITPLYKNAAMNLTGRRTTI